MNLSEIFEYFDKNNTSSFDKGNRFENLIKNYLLTDRKYNFKNIYNWAEFPFREEFGGHDIGIDLVGLDNNNQYWAIQCKFHSKNTSVDKSGVDSFLATSSKSFNNGMKFSYRLWIENYGIWNENAEKTIKNQNPPLSRIMRSDLENSGVDWDKIFNGIYGKEALQNKKDLFEHQKNAIEKSHEYFKSEKRGKLIMACGTGKTLTALKIAEKETNGNGLVLFLVPSIALLGQTLNEWNAQSDKPIYSIVICSDSKVEGKTVREDNSIEDLPLPATTDTKVIKDRLEKALNNSNRGMIVVFSTYQSINVISEAQNKINDFVFDLIICDEAHRTTGVSIAEQDESSFIKVHNNDFIKGHKRLYMTATPRIYSEDSKIKAKENSITLCSMDDEKLYGKEIYRIGFGKAVENGLLSDYKVLILTISSNNISESMQHMIADDSKEINTDDAAKLVGCINGLSKRIIGDNGLLKNEDPNFMKRAVAFCQSIKISKKITATFNGDLKEYYKDLNDNEKKEVAKIEAKHIDGTMNATVRSGLLSWLKSEEENDNNLCKILTNVKCLSEGVDVPSLDAVLFLSAKNSQVDVVQSVGRVMRKAEGKKYGYIIIPIFIPANEDPIKALDNNERYKVVWTVLNALRAHDDRFNAVVNKIDLNKQKPDNIAVVGIPANDEDGRENIKIKNKDNFLQYHFNFAEYQGAIYAKLVDKVGDRKYWEQWSKDIADIAITYTKRINDLISKEGEHKKEFDKFLSSLQQNINPTIDRDNAIEMLSQHLITQPVFEALFENYSFVNSNPVSKSMANMIKLLENQAFSKELKDLEKFYQSIKMRASGIDNAEGKQKIILELYDKFFKTAFPKMVEKLGIVYTPLECVDFIVKSINVILKEEFESDISDKNVKIIDPFVGTGTFMTRLMKNIEKEKLEYKYKNELYANEIILLAYYIASINIENTYHDIMGGEYKSFEGISLTDTFQLNEDNNKDYKNNTPLFPFFTENIERINKQLKAPIKVIMANPPYSIGQKSANDNAQNVSYPNLEERIRNTYVKYSKSTSNKSSYDTYIKAFRWASDRLEENGLIAFISNGSFLDGSASDGFRRCLENEFEKIYIINLRGNQRTSGEVSRKEGGKIFGSGSRTPVAITFLVKKNKSSLEENKKADIFYYDIGDYLSREEKLEKIKDFDNIKNIKFGKIKPNKYGDWINKRSNDFYSFIPLSTGYDFNTNSKSFFSIQLNGFSTGRDASTINYDKKYLLNNIKNNLNYYNNLIETINDKENYNFEDSEKNIQWTRELKKKFKNNKKIKFDKSLIREASYRPFNKQLLYAEPHLIETYGKIRDAFLDENMIITITRPSSSKEFSCLITDKIVDYHYLGDTQAFPLYYYEAEEEKEKSKYVIKDISAGKDNKGYQLFDYRIKRKFAISDYIMKLANEKYGRVCEEDIFYYVYGILHSPKYRIKYANDLKKMLPHIPLLEKKELFFHFADAGKRLALLHLNYENQKHVKEIKISGIESGNFRAQKMKFGKVNSSKDKTTIIYNNNITISNIPEKAYDYIVNGKSAIEWIMERYQYTIDKDTEIINDPNEWMQVEDNKRYILDLLLSVITVSVRTMEIVDNFLEHDF